MTEHSHHELFFLNLFENFVQLKMNFENRIKFYFSSSFTLPFKGSQPLGQWDGRPSLSAFRSVRFSSVAQLCLQLFVNPWTAAHQASLSITNPRILLKLLSIELVMPSNHLILWCPLLFPPSIFPSIRVFSNESVLHIRWPKVLELQLQLSVLPMNIQDWFPLGLTGCIFLQSKGLSRVFSNTTLQKHQFFSTQLSLWSNSHIRTWLLEKAELWLDGPLSAK